jgi:hypothetical protein
MPVHLIFLDSATLLTFLPYDTISSLLLLPMSDYNITSATCFRAPPTYECCRLVEYSTVYSLYETTGSCESHTVYMALYPSLF